MKTQIINIAAKAAPFVKKYGIALVMGVSGAFEAISEQKKAAQIEDLVKRVTELEKLNK